MEKYLVTGASGYIASWIVKYLLERGDEVHGTVRKISDTGKTGHLHATGKEYPGKLQLFEADLTNRESFRKAMEGCTKIVHTASPFFITNIRNPRKDLIEPALEGTRNVLSLASRFPSVRRIVVTSSVAAIHGDAADVLSVPGRTFTEEHWNTSSSEHYNPYQYSKTIAEREAWKMAGNQGQWTLATINPGFVMGPSLSRRVDSTSIDTMRALLNGKYKNGVPNLWFGIVDVRDVAMAHILAADNALATGRHLCVARVLPLPEMASILMEKFPERPIPKSTVPDFLLYLAGPFMGFSWKFLKKNLGIPFNTDNTKSRENLGLQYHPIHETLHDHAEQLIRDGLV